MNIRITSSAILLLLSSMIFTLTDVKAQSPFPTWISRENEKHTLVGKIWSLADRQFITAEELVARLAYRNYVLMGETHDNADHHNIHGWLIGKIVRYDRAPAVVMEMIDRDQSGELETYYNNVKARKQPQPAENLGPVLKWKERGWPDWNIYVPVATAVFNHNLPLLPGSASPSDIKNIKEKSLKSLNAEQTKALGLDEVFSLSVMNSLKDELGKSHCNLVPYTALQPMADIQRYRDAVMADSLIKAAHPSGAILIAGSGHIRKDRGVPYYILRRQPQALIVTLAMTEVISGKDKPEDYLAESSSSEPTLDYIWFTPGLKREDPCIELKKKFQTGK